MALSAAIKLVQGIQGPAGTNGTNGTNGSQGDKGGLRYYFDSSTSAGIGSNGSLRFDNATIGSVANIYINILDVLGNNFAAYIAQWAASSSIVKGYIIIKENLNSGTPFAVFSLTAVTNNSTYYTISVTNVVGTIPVNGDQVVVEWLRVGDSGAGATTVNVNSSPISSPNFNGTTPAAPAGNNNNVTFQVSGSNVSGTVPGMIRLALSSSSGTYCGQTSFPSAAFTVGTGKTLHLKIGMNRTATGNGISIILSQSGTPTNGYMLQAQTDANWTNNYYNGTFHNINSAGGNDLVGPVTWDIYISITAPGSNGIGIGGTVYTPNGLHAWTNLALDKNIDITGALILSIAANAFSDINDVQYEIL